MSKKSTTCFLVFLSRSLAMYVSIDYRYRYVCIYRYRYRYRYIYIYMGIFSSASSCVSIIYIEIYEEYFDKVYHFLKHYFPYAYQVICTHKGEGKLIKIESEELPNLSHKQFIIRPPSFIFSRENLQEYAKNWTPIAT